MDFHQMFNRLKTIGSLKKKFDLIDNQKHKSEVIQAATHEYQELRIRTGLLHAYCNGSFSFDTARCSLLFYDWYVQKIRENYKKHVVFLQTENGGKK